MMKSILGKKMVALLSVVVMTAGLLAGCGSKDGEDTAASSEYTEEAFGDIEALDELTTLSIGSLSSSTHGFTNYLIGKLGGYDAANIDEEVIVFGGGSILVEAMVSGDCEVGVYGLGGTLAGTIGQGFVNLGAASRDYHALQFFAANDSALVAAGENSDIAGIYGTAEDWKGSDIFLPVGSTLHYVLSKGLEKLGLTTDDVELTHMEVPNINTALLAGKCEIGGVWTNYPYGDLNETATPVMTAEAVDVTLITCFAAPESLLADTAKSAAIEKWMELYFAAVDWMYASDENLETAIDWFMEWNEENGIASVRTEIEAHCEYQRCYTLEDNIEMFAEQSELGDFSKMVEYNVEPLEFYVDQGIYSEADLEKFIEPQYFDSSFIDALAE